MADNCDGLNSIGCTLGDIGNSIGQAVSFASDPFGATLKAMKDGATSLTKDVLPVLTTAIQPDLSAAFFINAYKVSFAAGILVMVVLLIFLIIRTAEGEMAGRDLVQSLAKYAPMFVVGTAFGPLAGMTLVELFHALTDSIIEWAIGGQAEQIINGITDLISKLDPIATPGGVILAIFLMFGMLFGLLFILVILLCQLVTLYFTGALVPLLFVFIIDPNRRKLGLGIIGVWVGVLAAHPLLFFLVGFAFSIMGDTLQFPGQQDGLKTLVTFIVALIAIWMAAASPLLMMKFFPALQQAFTPTPSASSGGGSDIGRDRITDVINDHGNGGREAPGPSENPTTNVITGTQSNTETATTEQTLSNTTDETIHNQKVPGPSSAPSAETTTGVGATEGTAAGIAEAGAAESSTGVGAVVGVPTLIAAAGVAAAEAAKTGADSLVAHATAPMDESAIGGDNT